MSKNVKLTRKENKGEKKNNKKNKGKEITNINDILPEENSNINEVIENAQKDIETEKNLDPKEALIHFIHKGDCENNVKILAKKYFKEIDEISDSAIDEFKINIAKKTIYDFNKENNNLITKKIFNEINLIDVIEAIFNFINNDNDKLKALIEDSIKVSIKRELSDVAQKLTATKFGEAFVISSILNEMNELGIDLKMLPGKHFIGSLSETITGTLIEGLPKEMAFKIIVGAYKLQIKELCGLTNEEIEKDKKLTTFFDNVLLTKKEIDENVEETKEEENNEELDLSNVNALFM